MSNSPTIPRAELVLRQGDRAYGLIHFDAEARRAQWLNDVPSCHKCHDDLVDDHGYATISHRYIGEPTVVCSSCQEETDVLYV